MKRLALVFLLCLFPAASLAQGVARVAPDGEVLLLSRHIAGAVTAVNYNSVTLPARGFRVDRVTAHLTSASGGGAGSTTFRISDGTNNCDCAILCTATQAGTGKNVPCTGACAFAPSVLLTLSVSATSCTSTQPAFVSLDVRGKWL